MMNQRDIFKKLGYILTELNEQYEFLGQNPDRLSDLELELFLANAHFLSEHVEIIKKLNAHVSDHKEATPLATEVVVETEKPIEVEIPQESISAKLEHSAEEDFSSTEQILKHDFFKPDTELKETIFEFDLSKDSVADDKFDFEQDTVEKIFDRPLSKEEEEILARKKQLLAMEEPKQPLNVEQEEPALIEEDEVGPEPFLVVQNTAIVKENVIHENDEVVDNSNKINAEESLSSTKHNTAPINKAFDAKPKPTLNELLANNTVSNAPSIKPAISDLKQAISLNEKLLFIKNLFNGYNLAYSEAIDLINKMDDFETADVFLKKNYAAKFNWADKQNTVDQFYDLLNRRFSK